MAELQKGGGRGRLLFVPSSASAAALLGGRHTNRRLPFIRPFYIRDALLLGARSICLHISKSEGEGVGVEERRGETQIHWVEEDWDREGIQKKKTVESERQSRFAKREKTQTANCIGQWVKLQRRGATLMRVISSFSCLSLFIATSSSSNQRNIWL